MAESAGMRRRAVLDCSESFARYQREWFEGVRARAKTGEPFAVLSADAPHEIYRAMDIDYVVVQWWSSLIAAKQLGPVYLARLADAGYPNDHDQYNVLPLGEVLADEPASAPWGGLPRPTILQTSLSTDGMRQLFEVWAARTGAVFYPLEHSVDVRADPGETWWEDLPHDWDRFLPADRLDLLADELAALVRALEETTGRRFSESRFGEVMDLANRQAEHNRATRDLVAVTIPAPVSVADTMPAVMIPQWHRGSQWGYEAAGRLRSEVEERVAAGAGACPNERVRLMWLGRGLWSSMGLYQWFEDELGAVFVWSMYLGLAADGYLRYIDGRDPLRALAARLVPMGDVLRMPPWSSAWHVKEAQLHQIDGAVSFGEDDYFSAARLESAGVPVLSIRADNVDRRTWTEASVRDAVSEFVEARVEPVAARRRDGG